MAIIYLENLFFCNTICLFAFWSKEFNFVIYISGLETYYDIYFLPFFYFLVSVVIPTRYYCDFFIINFINQPMFIINSSGPITF